MKNVNEVIEAVKNGGMWMVVDDILYHLDQARTLESENKRLTEANTAIADAMAAYRCSWGEMYREKYGRYPSYPF